MQKSITRNLTEGSILSTLIRFSLPFLLSSFLQTFYGLADLFITGLFYGASTISAVSIGSQLMHMITVIVVGLAMGSTVSISRSVGLKDNRALAINIGNTISLFAIFSIILTAILLFCSDLFLKLIKTPEEAFIDGRNYCLICFAGIPFITAYNVLSSIYRGMGDSKSPMFFIFVAGVLNIALDFLFIGLFKMGAAGAALATVISQACSVILAFCRIRKVLKGSELSLKGTFRFSSSAIVPILKIGVPVACQDGFIQISFIIITAIANSRGVFDAAAVGIVEKIICFLFLVPSAMLASVSAIGAQNAGANKHNRSFKTLGYAILISVIFGCVVSILGNIFPYEILGIFSRDPNVVLPATQYFRTYVTDCAIAGIHFCCSGFFCAYGKSFYSFIHNILSICFLRIPLTYFAAKYFENTLYPMGMAAPIGSLFSAIVCIIIFFILRKKILANKL